MIFSITNKNLPPPFLSLSYLLNGLTQLECILKEVKPPVLLRQQRQQRRGAVFHDHEHPLLLHIDAHTIEPYYVWVSDLY